MNRGLGSRRDFSELREDIAVKGTTRTRVEKHWICLRPSGLGGAWAQGAVGFRWVGL